VNRRQVLVALLAVAIVLITLGILGSRPEVRDWVRENIILPVSFLLWIIGMSLRSLDQHVIWLGIILIFGLILVSNLVDAIRLSLIRRDVQEGGTEAAPVSRGRLSFWVMQIHLVRRGGASFDFARVEFRRLTQQVMEYRGGTGNGERLPPAIERFLDRRFINLDMAEAGSFDWIARLFGGGTPRPPSPDQDVADLTLFLERQLEIRNEDEHR
jgi:hypothetical protein